MKLLLVAVLAATLGGNLWADELLAQKELDGIINCRGQLIRTLEQCTHDAVSEDPAVAQSAIRELRGRGPEGLRALLETHRSALRLHETNLVFIANNHPDAGWMRLKTALDGVSAQRDCYASKLFWYTDFEQAKVAARATAKPILSLRLLGKLDEEFSCANSRFFRTTLYANAEIAQYLNDHFVLHWKSVRPVPKVTIDFGDGRKLERTLTGNSIHYVLNGEGRVIDALPGLYGPQTFLVELKRIEGLAQSVANVSAEKQEMILKEFHQTRFAALNNQYLADQQRVATTPVLSTIVAEALTPSTVPGKSPTALVAGRRTSAKGGVETTILRRTAAGEPDRFETNEEVMWRRIAELHADSSRLDNGARKLISEKTPSASTAARKTFAKTIVESPLFRQIRNLERSISEDTVRNEYLFHTKIHEWLASGPEANIDQLNTRVYAELFLTPESDPWLGLRSEDTFAALENDGLTLSKQ